jgi:hypothetical protein
MKNLGLYIGVFVIVVLGCFFVMILGSSVQKVKELEEENKLN